MTHKFTESSFLSYFSESGFVLFLADNLSAATLTLGGNICLHLVPGDKLLVFMCEENMEDKQRMCDICTCTLQSESGNSKYNLDINEHEKIYFFKE